MRTAGVPTAGTATRACVLGSPILRTRGTMLAIRATVGECFTVVGFFVVSSFLSVVRALRELVRPGTLRLFIYRFLTSHHTRDRPALFLYISFE